MNNFIHPISQKKNETKRDNPSINSLKSRKLSGNIELQRLKRILFVIFPMIWIILFQPIVSLPPRPELESVELTIVKNSYATLSVSQKTIFDDFMDNEFSYGSNVVDKFASNRGTRTWIRIASGLLYRNLLGDIENASYIIQKILDTQYTNRSNEDMYGVYQTELYSDRVDVNWREFVGCELIIILEKHSDKLSSDLISSIEQSLLCAAEGAYLRNVRPSYSNIAIMSAFLMEYVGIRMNLPAIRDGGVLKSWEIFLMYTRHNTFSEYNSPTYYGVDMLAIAMWRDLGPTEEMRRMGAEMERSFWDEIGNFYHFGFKNIVGPYFRTYDIDMRYNYAIIGLWIALAIDDLEMAPFPQVSTYKHFECRNIFPFVQLGHSVPDNDVLNKFLGFTESRFLERLIPSDISSFGKEYKVTAMLDNDWMMGGVSGRIKDDDQFVVGALHWNSSVGNSLAWLVVSGMDYLDVEVSPTSMTIMQTGRTENITFYINCENITVGMISGSTWNLPGLNVEIEGEYSKISAELADSSEFNEKFEFGKSQTLIKIYTDLESISLSPKK